MLSSYLSRLPVRLRHALKTAVLTVAMVSTVGTAMAFAGTASASAANINVWAPPYTAHIRYCPHTWCNVEANMYNYSWVTLYSYCDTENVFGNYWSTRWFHITWPYNGWVHSSLVDHQYGVMQGC